MFELQLTGQQQDNIELTAEADNLFRRAALKGKLRMIWAKLTGRSARLLDLAAVEAGQTIAARHDKGTQVIPTAHIRGSESRAKDFDNQFNPLEDHTRQRWMSVAKAWLTGVTLPPVQVVQVDDLYFVRDGHHRVSVARALGQTDIDAEVTSWDVYKPKPGQTTPFVCRPVCSMA